MTAFNEIDTTSPLPGFYAEIDLEAGALGRGDRIRKLYLLGSRVTAGTMSDNEIGTQPLENWADAQTRWGAGSEGAYMASVAIRTNGGPRVPLYPVALPDAGGTKAQGVFTATGAVGADEGGYAICRIGEVTWTTTIAGGNSQQDTTDAIVAAWNDENKVPTWIKPPVTLTSQIQGAGPNYEVEIEANNSGAHMNQLQIEVVKFTAGTQTLVADAATLGTNQAGVGDVTLTTALTSLLAVRTHYIAFSDFIEGDSTKGLKALKTHINAKSDGNNMLGGYVIAGHDDTLSAATTLTAAVDNNDGERMYLCWEEESKSHPMAMSVSQAVLQAAQVDPSRPLNGVEHNVLAAQKPAKRPTNTSCITALAGGVTPLRTPDDDDSTVTTVRLIAMRMDLGYFDIGILETLDEFRDRGNARCAAKFKNYKIVESDDDPAAGADYVTTPRGVLAEWVAEAFDMQEEGKLQKVKELLVQCKAEYVAGGGVALQFPGEFVPGLHKVMTQIKAIYPG